MRIPIIRRDRDGTIIDGTAELIIETVVKARWFRRQEATQVCVGDFRGLDGEPLILPGGSSFEAVVPVPGTFGL